MQRLAFGIKCIQLLKNHSMNILVLILFFNYFSYIMNNLLIQGTGRFPYKTVFGCKARVR